MKGSSFVKPFRIFFQTFFRRLRTILAWAVLKPGRPDVALLDADALHAFPVVYAGVNDSNVHTTLAPTTASLPPKRKGAATAGYSILIPSFSQEFNACVRLFT